MRNIAAYPLTDEEIIQHCERELAKLALPNAPVGGMQGMIYQAIIERVQAHPRQPADILNQGKFITTTTSTTTAND
jgi:hypothetical protein